MKPILAILLALPMAVACTALPHIKVDGIDGLKTTEYALPQSQVISICAAKMGIPAAFSLLVMPLACAVIVLESWSCTIYYALATADFTLEHERRHCKGYWHDDGLLAYRDRWRSNLERDL